MEKVWNRAEALGRKHYTIVVHGKYNHEETIATFSHSKQNSPTIVVRNVEETKLLRDIILGKIPSEEFYTLFEGNFLQALMLIHILKELVLLTRPPCLRQKLRQLPT